MESALYVAAVDGSVEKLLELIEQDPLILDRSAINRLSETPLHVAALLGHTEFAKEILIRRPQLAKERDLSRSSPLHLACGKGHLEIVRALLQVHSDMCLAFDEHGRNPLCLAAMNGRIDVLEELVRAGPQAARAGADQGGTILHACVKNNQLEALKFLVEAINDDSFINRIDDFGFTILHLAVSNKQLQTVKFLLTRSVEVNALSSNGFTALDILSQSPRDLRDLDIAESLRSAEASRTTAKTIPNYESPLRKRERKANLANKKNAIMVVASLIATMAFSAGLNPPGGLWQDNSTGEPDRHVAGESILAYQGVYDLSIFSSTIRIGRFSGFGGYMLFNTVGFVASLSVILLLITGLPFKKGFFMWVLTLIMWVAITSMTLTYLISLVNFTPDSKSNDLMVTSVLYGGLMIWVGVMGLVVVGHALYLFIKLFRKLLRSLRASLPRDVNPA